MKFYKIFSLFALFNTSNAKRKQFKMDEETD